jgi:hypothetical protein
VSAGYEGAASGAIMVGERPKNEERWEAVLKTVGLEPMQGVLERKERLRKLADVVSQNRRGTDGTIT